MTISGDELQRRSLRIFQLLELSCAYRTVTYCELNARSNQLARHLCVERSFEAVEGLLGILKTGACTCVAPMSVRTETDIPSGLPVI